MFLVLLRGDGKYFSRIAFFFVENIWQDRCTFFLCVCVSYYREPIAHEIFFLQLVRPPQRR